MNCTMITAHSGCEDIRPDSVDSVKKGIELGADAVEVDVQLDENGRLYLSHDPKEDPSNAESLENIFRVIAEKDICVNCDIKNPDTIFPILRLADEYGIPKRKLILSGFIKYDVLKAHPEIAERARVFLHTTNEVFDHSDAVPYEDDRDFLIKNAEVISGLFARLGAECLNICYDRVDHEIIETYVSFGLRMSLWTVNEPEEQRRFLSENILNLTTLSPSSALAVRNGIE